MAEAYNTLNGLIQFNDKNLADLNVSDLLDRAPLLQIIHTQLASNGTLHKYLKQTTAASASFRKPLAGVAKTASQDTLVTVTMKLIDGSFDTDVALADAYKGGRDAWLQLELMRTMRTLMFTLERQVIYGTAQQTGTGYLSDEAGFTGLANSTDLDGTADDMVIAAATAGSTVDSQTSVWLLRHGQDDVSFVLGNEGRFVVEDEPTVIQKAADTTALDAGQFYPALFVPVTGWGGLQLGGKYSAARICNIETKLTDDDLYNGLSLFPSSAPPNVIVMNRNALKLLRESRTATSPTGSPAPRPTEIDGIPIVVTDAVRSDEPVIA